MNTSARYKVSVNKFNKLIKIFIITNFFSKTKNVLKKKKLLRKKIIFLSNLPAFSLPGKRSFISITKMS